MRRFRPLLLLLLILSIFPLPVKSDNDSLITPEEYIEAYTYYAVREMLLYRIPASITLAQGLLETGNGNSRLAIEARNHFGIKCHEGWEGGRIYHDDDEAGECFRVYDDPETSYRDHSLFLTSRPRYAGLFELELTDYKGWAKGLKAAGYATNPKYPELLIMRIETYKLHYLDTLTSLPDWMPQYPDFADNLDRVTDPNGEPDPDEMVVFPGGSYPILTFNRINYVKARTGDTPKILAAHLDMMSWQIVKYNEIDPGYVFKTGERVYLQPKRRKGTEETHEFQAGETLWDLSQQYGVKLKRVYKFNNLSTGQVPDPGTVIFLRRKSR